MAEPPDDFVALDSPQTLVEVDLRTGETRMVLEGEHPLPSRSELARVVVTGDGALGDLDDDALRHSSSARLALPSNDIDSVDLYAFEVAAYTADDHAVVVVTGNEPAPREVVLELASALAEGFVEYAIDTSPRMQGPPAEVAENAKWSVVTALRTRIRKIEESVREALSDEHISSADYTALRDYPVRLAKVERVAGLLPDPTWELHLEHFPSLVSDRFWERLRGVPDEARESTARLSGLIASQQVVLAQKQAAGTQRFQRLVTLVGTTVLVPGLVAAVFGANVDLPGTSERAAFWAMLLLMFGIGLGSYVLLRAVETGKWTDVARRLGLPTRLKIGDGARTLLLLTGALAAIGAGVTVLLCG